MDSSLVFAIGFIGFAIGSFLTTCVFVYVEFKARKREEREQERAAQNLMWQQFINKVGGQNG